MKETAKEKRRRFFRTATITGAIIGGISTGIQHPRVERATTPLVEQVFQATKNHEHLLEEYMNTGCGFYVEATLEERDCGTIRQEGIRAYTTMIQGQKTPAFTEYKKQYAQFEYSIIATVVCSILLGGSYLREREERNEEIP